MTIPHMHVYGRWYIMDRKTRYRKCVIPNCHHYQEEEVSNA